MHEVVLISRKFLLLLFLWIGMPSSHFESQGSQVYQTRVEFELFETSAAPLILDADNVHETIKQVGLEIDTFRYKIR